MEFYHDKMFKDEIVKIALEARRKGRYLQKQNGNEDEAMKYKMVEGELLNVAQFIQETMGGS